MRRFNHFNQILLNLFDILNAFHNNILLKRLNIFRKIDYINPKF